MPVPVASGSCPDFHQDVGRVYKLIADKKELEVQNRGLRDLVQRLEETLDSRPNEISDLQQANSSLTSQLEETVKQLIESEEKVMSAESRADQFERRLTDVSDCRDRVIRQHSTTMSELRDQNGQLQDFLDQMRGERDNAQGQVDQLRDMVVDQQRAMHNMKEKESQLMLQAMADMEALCSRMEKQVSAEQQQRMQKEEQCVAMATEVEEVRARMEEVSQQLTTLRAAHTTLTSEVSSLRTEVKEKDIAHNLLKEELQVLKMECNLHKDSHKQLQDRIEELRKEIEDLHREKQVQQQSPKPCANSDGSPSFAVASPPTRQQPPFPPPPNQKEMELLRELVRNTPELRQPRHQEPKSCPQVSSHPPHHLQRYPSPPPRPSLPRVDGPIGEMEQLEMEMHKIAERWSSWRWRCTR